MFRALSAMKCSKPDNNIALIVCPLGVFRQKAKSPSSIELFLRSPFMHPSTLDSL